MTTENKNPALDIQQLIKLNKAFDEYKSQKSIKNMSKIIQYIRVFHGKLLYQINNLLKKMDKMNSSTGKIDDELYFNLSSLETINDSAKAMLHLCEREVGEIMASKERQNGDDISQISYRREIKKTSKGGMNEDNDEDENKPKLLNLYASWCGASQSFLPTWDELESAYDPEKITLKKYDCAERKDIIKKYKVQWYPTIKVIFKGESHDFPTDINNDFSTVAEFVKKITGVDVKGTKSQKTTDEYVDLNIDLAGGARKHRKSKKHKKSKKIKVDIAKALPRLDLYEHFGR